MMRRIVLIASAFLSVAAVGPSLAAAAQRYASPTGSATAACTEADPCDLSTAVTGASSGDEVILLASSTDYTLPVSTSLFVPGGVQVHGQDGQPRPTVVGHNGLAPLLPNGSNVTLRHLELRNDWAAVELSQGIVVRDVIGISSVDGATACFWAGTATLTDSVCWATGATNTRGGGSNISGGTITAILRNVTAVGSASGLSFSVNDSNTASTVDAKNVIAMGATDVVASATGGTTSMTVTMGNSNYDTRLQLGSGTVTAPGSPTNQTDAPFFVDLANGNFHQAPGSATINAGVVDPANGPTDIDGDARNHGTAPDIGADEFDAAPNALDDSPPALTEDDPATGLGVLANDTDVDGGPKTVQSITGPSHGTATVTGGGADIQYQPAADYCGSDSFTYTVNGGDSATVSITVTCVEDSPLAAGDSATVVEDAPAIPIDVLANDTDVDGGTKGVASKTDPAHGTAAVTGGGTGVSYQPAADYCGSDSFTYTLNGGSTATVSITVSCLAPNTSFRKKPAKVTRKRRAKFRFASTEAGSTFLCKLDRRPFRPCRSPAIFTVRPGKHRLRVKAVDSAGTPDATPASYRWKVLPP